MTNHVRSASHFRVEDKTSRERSLVPSAVLCKKAGGNATSKRFREEDHEPLTTPEAAYEPERAISRGFDLATRLFMYMLMGRPGSSDSRNRS